jgi:hypothetical protein
LRSCQVANGKLQPRRHKEHEGKEDLKHEGREVREKYGEKGVLTPLSQRYSAFGRGAGGEGYNKKSRLHSLPFLASILYRSNQKPKANG